MHCVPALAGNRCGALQHRADQAIQAGAVLFGHLRQIKCLVLTARGYCSLSAPEPPALVNPNPMLRTQTPSLFGPGSAAKGKEPVLGPEP